MAYLPVVSLFPLALALALLRLGHAFVPSPLQQGRPVLAQSLPPPRGAPKTRLPAAVVDPAMALDISSARAAFFLCFFGKTSSLDHNKHFL